MSITSLAIKDVNNLSSDQFIKLLGNVVEHYPAAAIGILKNRPFCNVQDVCNSINAYMDGLSLNGKCYVMFCACMYFAKFRKRKYSPITS